MSDLPSWAVVGRQCVCVEDDWSEERAEYGNIPTRVPMLREVLTITAVVQAYSSIYLGFAEIPAQGNPNGWHFHVASFRPLVSEEDDLREHFEIYLNADHRATRRVGEDA